MFKALITRFASRELRKSKSLRRRQSRQRPRLLNLERLEDRLAPAIDLIGYDARPLGGQFAQNYFHVLDASPAFGNPIHFNFNVANLGNTGGGSFAVAVYLSTDSTITTGDYLLGRFNGLSVPNAGTVSTFTNATLTLPYPNPFGSGSSFTNGMIVDIDNTVAESNESNNSNQGTNVDKAPVTIAPPPTTDLGGFDARPLGTASAQNYFHLTDAAPAWGDQVHLNFNVANFGNSGTAGTYTVAVYLSADSTITTGDYLLGNFTGLSVPGGGQFTSFTGATLSLPASNPLGGSGSFTIGMIVDSGNTISESNESNNSNQGTGVDKASVSIAPP